MERDVVFGDCNLRVDIYHLLSQVMHIGNLIDNWDDEVDTGFEDTLELLEPVNHSSVVLSNNYAKPIVRDCTRQAFADFLSTKERTSCYGQHCWL